MLRRRSLLTAGLAALAGCASTPPPGRAVEVADGVFLVPGSGGVADERNLGRIGNAGFVVGPAGVIAVDTGTSFLHGQALLAEIARVTPQPVKVALVTHTRPEFLFGGGAFQARGIPVRMHDRTARLMASRCETCLKQLRQQVGEGPLAGTAMYKPDQTYESGGDLGSALIGRPVRVLHFGHSSGPGDVAVLDERSATLFAGGLLDQRRIPDIQDSVLDGWKAALAQLQGLGVRTVIPGHGPAASSELVGTVARYLAALERRVREMVAAGDSLLGVADAADLPEFERWDQYDTIHRRNASIAFVRFEREMLFK